MQIDQLFGLLRDSILKKRQVSFDYFSGSGNSEHRIVHPWKLVYRGQAWYLLGRNAFKFWARFADYFPKKYPQENY